MEKINMKYGLRKTESQLPGNCFNINGKETINRVFAGVGIPIKLVVCLVSKLNFARRNAENTVMIKGKN